MLGLVAMSSSSHLLPVCRHFNLLQIARRVPGGVLIGCPFDPPHLLPWVGVVPHPGTEGQYTERAFYFYQVMDKKPIDVKNECPGCVATYLQIAICNKAYSLVLTGIVTAEKLGSSIIVD